MRKISLMRRMTAAPFKFRTFSKKQRMLLNWWHKDKKYHDMDGIIADGAIRSGKTVAMVLSFVIWAMVTFSGENFIMAGKTVGSFRRNVLAPLKSMMISRGYDLEDLRSENLLTITRNGVTNYFYIFGGKDEASQDLVQGITAAGCYLDEVALMPESFVDQATGRLSVEGSKMWFNCNPRGPLHWFKLHWIDQRGRKRLLYLHFTMEDNPSLSETVRERYRRMYGGIFYDRFVLGKWTVSDGLVYPMFDKSRHVSAEVPDCPRYVISCDYGTVNPTSMGLWGESDGIWYRLREYYYAARREGLSRTDEEHYAGLETLAEDLPVECVVVDPSAASFIACIARHGKFRVMKAKNDVLSGIRQVSDALQADKIRICAGCEDILREFSQYCWNASAAGDVPKKEHDHAMDDMRYFVSTILCGNGEQNFMVMSLAR